MKKRIISLFLIVSLLLSVVSALTACGDEEKDTPKTEIPPITGSEGNVIKNELEGASLSGIIELFSSVISADLDMAETFSSYDIGVLLSGDKRITLKDGIFAYSDKGTVKSAAAYGSEGIRLVSVTEDGSDYRVNDGVETGSTKLFEWLPKIRELLLFAEEHLELPELKDEDIVRSEDGIFYLGNDYTHALVLSAFTAYMCINEGILPEQLDEEKRAELLGYAEKFASHTELKLGFGLVMKRINSLRLSFSSKEITEFTGGELDAVNADAYLKLNSERTHLDAVGADITAKSVKNGDESLKLNASTVFDKGGKPTYIELMLDEELIGALIGEEENAEPIFGIKKEKLSLKFSPYSKVQSIDFAYSSASYRTAQSTEAYRESTYAMKAGALSSAKPAAVSLTYSIDGENASFVETAITGEAVNGASVLAPDLPQRVKELLEIN